QGGKQRLDLVGRVRLGVAGLIVVDEVTCTGSAVRNLVDRGHQAALVGGVQILEVQNVAVDERPVPLNFGRDRDRKVINLVSKSHYTSPFRKIRSNLCESLSYAGCGAGSLRCSSIASLIISSIATGSPPRFAIA